MTAILDHNPMEHIQLLARFNEFHANEIGRISEDDRAVAEESSIINFFLEQLLALETTAKKEGKEDMPLDETQQKAIAHFQEVVWPAILKRNHGVIPEHRNPFPDYIDKTHVKVSDISEIKGRLAYLANQQERFLSTQARAYQRIINADYLISMILAHEGANNPNKPFTKNQITR